MFLRHSWYVAAWAHELGDRPLARTILGEPVVLFLIGHDGAIGALIAMIAGLILLVHLILGAILTLAELATAHRS